MFRYRVVKVQSTTITAKNFSINIFQSFLNYVLLLLIDLAVDCILIIIFRRNTYILYMVENIYLVIIL